MRKKTQLLFGSSLIAFTLFSLTLLLMPKVSGSGKTALGIAFWLLLAVGIALLVMASSSAQNALAEEDNYKLWRRLRPLYLSAFSTKLGAVFDGASLLLFLLIIIMYKTELKYSYTMFILFFALAFSLCMRCAFNSKTYKVLSVSKKNKINFTAKQKTRSVHKHEKH